ncbi:metalloprotease 1 [Arthroderma uncinatum]|uniref:metalloprotease 1 n=1 Tax=Arthroderma uncinatum TaxID=74035 RepID=UPI00144A9075|nr:metalloprotease 1 [Arthroderma uncinatum]KAF3490566.1 metalloprotease 1 [Arthroderma uncinatum]
MRFSVLLSSIAALSTVAAAERICGAIPHRTFAKESKEALAVASASGHHVKANISVETYFHVITDGSKGEISDETLAEQLAVMNDNYGPAGISFKLMDTSRTDNSNWAAGGDETGMKRALRKGTYSSLNVYFAPNLEGGLLGFCYFPKASPSENDKLVDGCVILSGSVPGGETAPFNEGKTTTHEVGHFMGLYHVFNEEQGNCQKDGDMVADTPVQGEKTSGCPQGKDSCPQEGVDSIHNYMDYSDDPCMNEFTPMQQARMQMMWQQFRAGN